MNPPVYKIRDLTKDYDGRRVLELPRLDIFPGEIFAIVGPSGAGKSTLLRMLNFLEHPSSGSIAFDSREFTADADFPLSLRRRVTTVFQRPILLSRTVRENVIYGLSLRGQKNLNGETTSVLDIVGLMPLADQLATTLSGGEAQRVALARAMVIQPDVLLLDEPTANLDPYNIKLIENIILKINQDRGTTLVLVTHNIFQARRLAHRVALILDGRMVEVSKTDDFFNSPKDPKTAAFVRGDMVY